MQLDPRSIVETHDILPFRELMMIWTATAMMMMMIMMIN
jgi:hypothetical protein